MARKTAGKKKSTTLSLRLTPALKTKARGLARRGRRSLNSLIEFLIRQEAERIEKKSRTRRKAKK
jgi:predicted HicB family RNase H-like nuclease